MPDSPRRLLVLEQLAAAAEAATAGPPPGWVKPEGLTESVLDRDVAAGLEFLAGLEKRLHSMEVRLYMSQRQSAALAEQTAKSTAALEQLGEQLGRRLAALEAVLRGAAKIDCVPAPAAAHARGAGRT